MLSKIKKTRLVDKEPFFNVGNEPLTLLDEVFITRVFNCEENETPLAFKVHILFLKSSQTNIESYFQ